MPKQRLITTYRGFFQLSVRHVIEAHGDDHPITEELAQPGTDEDADNHVDVEVHGQQHGDIGPGKGDGVNDGARQLLQWGGAKGDCRPFPLLGEGTVRGLALELARQEIVVLPADAATEFDEHDQQDSADAGGGKHAIVLDLPSGGEETSVDGVEVEEHLA